METSLGHVKLCLKTKTDVQWILENGGEVGYQIINGIDSGCRCLECECSFCYLTWKHKEVTEFFHLSQLQEEEIWMDPQESADYKIKWDKPKGA